MARVKTLKPKRDGNGTGRKNKSASNRLDPVTLEVARARLEAIVEEMGATLLRTAHSSIFVECKDYSVALLERDGGLVAMGQYIPHHQGGMQAALKSILAEKGLETIRPGDIYVTNDPYLGGTHMPDLNMFLPGIRGRRDCTLVRLMCTSDRSRWRRSRHLCRRRDRGLPGGNMFSVHQGRRG